MEEIEKEAMEDFTNKIKNELAELGLIKQFERLKITSNSKGVNWEYSLLGKVEDNINRADDIKEELDRRFK